MRRFLRSTAIRFMSKNKNKKAKGEPATAKAVQSSNEPIRMDKSGNICIQVLAKPGAKLNSITNISSDGVGVQIAAPPTEGEANNELIKYLSKVLGLPKSDLSLDKGSRSRNKIIVINKDATTNLNIINELLLRESSNT